MLFTGHRETHSRNHMFPRGRRGGSWEVNYRRASVPAALSVSSPWRLMCSVLLQDKEDGTDVKSAVTEAQGGRRGDKKRMLHDEQTSGQETGGGVVRNKQQTTM